MSPGDFLLMALSNLGRSRLRTSLTAAGVIIGVGALVAMLSFGSGMQRNIRQTFERLDAFTLLTVSLPEEADRPEGSPRLDEEALARLRSIPGVVLVYREVGVPARLQGPGGSETVLLRAVPPEAGGHAPFSTLSQGRFFSDSESREIILTERLASRLGLGEGQQVPGAEVQVVTARLDPGALAGLLRRDRTRADGADAELFARESTPFRVVGLWEGGFGGRDSASAFVPRGAAESLPAVRFENVFDLLRGAGGPAASDAVTVRVERPEAVERVARAVRAEGYEVFSFLEEFDEIRRVFLAMNGVLGTVGVIALIVAALGIINTMVTAVMERTREIGIMMAIGASRADIRRIFLAESAAIGLFGGGFGLLLGWGVTRLANRVGNLIIRESGVPAMDFFHLPAWLVIGALLFSLLISLLAALYPAGRAARVDPVSSLRRE